MEVGRWGWEGLHPPTTFIGVIVGHVEVSCALPLSHVAVPTGTVLWDVVLTWVGFALLTGTSIKGNPTHSTA